MKELIECYHKKRKEMLCLAIVFVLIAGGKYYLDAEGDGTKIDDRGNVVEVASGKRQRLVVKSESGKEYQLVINLQGREDVKAREEIPKKQEDSEEREVRKIKYEIEKSGTGRLPSKLESGKKITWQKERDYSYLMLFFLIPLVPLWEIVGERSKVKKRREEENRSIIKNLPAFTDNITLLISSGLTTSESVKRTMMGCRMGCDNDFFKGCMVKILEKSERENISLMSCLKEEGEQIGNSQLNRLVWLLMEGHYKGAQVVDKLQRESSLLWERRKQEGEIRGKMMETALVMPLGIILISLIAVASAPAMLKM